MAYLATNTASRFARRAFLCLIAMSAFLVRMPVAEAAANGALIVQPASDAPAELVDHAVAVTKARLAMGNQQATRLDDAACDLDCAVGQLESHQAAMAVQLELWVPRGFRSEGSLAITLKDARGSSTARVPVEEVDPEHVASAVATSLEMAMARWPSRGGVLVRVDGTPAGASVIIDHDPELGGVLPIEVRLSPGSHSISVSQYGYADADREIEVPGHLEDPMPLRVDLQPVSAARADDAGGPSRRKRRTHLAAAITLCVGGAAALVVGALALSRDGDCAQGAPSGACAERNQSSRGASLAYVSAGSLALAGGAFWATWVSLKWQPGGAHLSLRIPLSHL